MGPVIYPLLLECDFLGRVLWMSNCARSTLSNPVHLSDVSPLHFWRVWESRQTVLIWVQALEAESKDTKDLLRIRAEPHHTPFAVARDGAAAVPDRAAAHRAGRAQGDTPTRTGTPTAGPRTAYRRRPDAGRHPPATRSHRARISPAPRKRRACAEQHFGPAADTHGTGPRPLQASCIHPSGRGLRWNRRFGSCGRSAEFRNASRALCRLEALPLGTAPGSKDPVLPWIAGAL